MESLPAGLRNLGYERSALWTKGFSALLPTVDCGKEVVLRGFPQPRDLNLHEILALT